MKAPEKIYLVSDDKEAFVFTQKRTDNRGIEYTRTDVFIKKACAFLTQHRNFISFSYTFIDDFENYMKGE